MTLALLGVSGFSSLNHSLYIFILVLGLSFTIVSLCFQLVLRHSTLSRVPPIPSSLARPHQQQHAVHHVEHALHFTAEVRMAGRVDDVDLGVLVADGRVLAQDGDASLSLQVVAVHDPLLHLLVVAEHLSGGKSPGTNGRSSKLTKSC